MSSSQSGAEPKEKIYDFMSGPGFPPILLNSSIPNVNPSPIFPQHQFG